MDVLEVEDLTVTMAGNPADPMVVEGVSFSLAEGQVLGLTGRSGAGKTMIANALTGLLLAPAKISRGVIRIAGREVPIHNPRAWRGRRGREIFLIFQSSASALNPSLSVGRQIAEVLVDLKGAGPAQAGRRAEDCLAAVGLAGAYHLYPFQLSGGMRQRVQIALALALQPRIVMADEPTTGLDALSQVEILRLLISYKEERGAALILISHDLRIMAALADRVGVISRGRLVELAATTQILSRPRHPGTRELVEALDFMEAGVA
ncbi:MAG: ABC transporter ATP-binding protein [Thermodesulfobacteriota bacterium]